MIELSDVFVALPGGVGTLDEVLEAITTFDLRLHDKPTVLCNIDRFWDPFEDLIRSMRGYGVLRERMAQSYLVVPDVEASLGAALDKVEGLASAMLPVG
jgi:predicted Rossmann-fold nucleotide-binding protein